MFMLIGAAEKAGSGVDKMRRGWASQHWRSPMVREQVQPDRVCWRLPMVSLIPEESLARLGELFGEKFSKFNKNEVQVLVTADVEGVVDNSCMRQICTIHAADVTRLLQGLVAKGALVQEGQGRWSRYRLPETSHSVHKVAGDSVHKAARDSVHGAELLAIAQHARSQKRLQPAEMERIILELCQGRWLTRNQLSELLDRNPDGLRSRFLTPMVAHGRLRLRYPDKPNRADQAYTAGDSAKENPAFLGKDLNKYRMGVKQTSEAAFETAIEAALLADGYQSLPSSDFDRERAIFPATVQDFIRETQPNEWSRREARLGHEPGEEVLAAHVMDVFSGVLVFPRPPEAMVGCANGEASM